MRILMVARKESITNPYVSSLAEGLVKCGHEVVCNLDHFWNSFAKYDLLYFQWPEAIVEWEISRIDISELSRHLEQIKGNGIKMVITCHNLHPHNNDAKMMALYDLVYSKVDAFHHMGSYSFRVMKERYPNQYHFLAPHHIANGLWGDPFYASEAKRRLHISRKDIVISSFGAFRNNEEVSLFVDMSRDVTQRHLVFMAPRIPMDSFYIGRHIKRTIRYLKKLFLYQRIGIKYSGFLSDEELRIWLAASDIVFIQRKEILNSGNLPLAYAAGKVVVGPDIGNVGEILRETGNFVFDPNDSVSVKQAVQEAIDEVKNHNSLGRRNYNYAKENWTTTKICGLIDKELSIIFDSEFSS